MRFEQSSTIPAPKDRVWDFMMDVPRVAKCIPGVESVEDLGNDKYRGAVKVRVGPIGLTMSGDVSIVERDPERGYARMRGEGADKRVGGAVKADMEMQLVEVPGEKPATQLNIVADAQVMGRIGDFGQPVIRKKADQIMKDFSNNLTKAIAQEGEAEAPVAR